MAGNTLHDAICSVSNNNSKVQGPVVQSIVSLTSSLRGQLDKRFTIYNKKTMIFFVEKNERSFHPCAYVQRSTFHAEVMGHHRDTGPIIISNLMNQEIRAKRELSLNTWREGDSR